ncbi:MAG TPA: hypothetical protein VD887_02665 [Allosphingosinicella sp.]|nr:hypothetical protein [Allosphingosinicella sp.]
MNKSATEVMQEILFAATIDAIMALKAASKGLPNTLLRDLNAIHANTTHADLPPELQAAIAASVRSAFARLLKEGYSVAPAGAQAPRAPRPQGELVRRGGNRPERPGGPPRGPRGPRREGDGPRGPRPPGRGDRPRGPKGPR